MKMGEKLRSFVAVNLPDALREDIGRFIYSLRGSVRGVKWVKDENLHLTLKFLGDLDREALPAVTGALDRALAGLRAVRVSLRGAGAFPPRGRPRVVWIDMDAGTEGLALLQRSCEQALDPLGFPPEGRPFTPHLTIGRARDLRDAGPLLSALDAARGRSWGDFTADRVHLMRSELFPTGPSYSILHEVRLDPF